MELRHLKFFLAAANEGNITRAAEIVHTSQPNLSRQLQELENELGCTLFNRGKVITLTDSGELLKRRAIEILSLTSKTESELSASPTEISGTISIGFGEMQPVQDITKIAVEFKKQYPNVRFDFFTGTADQVKEQMEKGLLDVGLLLEPVEIEKYNFFRLKKKVRFVAVMKSSSPLAAKKTVTPSDLAPLPLIFPSRRNVQGELFSWFSENAQKLNVVATGNLAANTVILVLNELGVAIGSEGFSVPLGYENEITFRPLSPELSFSAVFAWKKTSRISHLTESFLHFVKEYLALH
ncbi:MAG: LysR family transcriptional regulator [Treponema sp.]